MGRIKYLSSKTPLKAATKNIGTLFLENRDKYGDNRAFAERVNEIYQYHSWSELTGDILHFAYFLATRGLVQGDHIAVISGNSYHRLVIEMAIMASGLVSVPIFFKYSEKMKSDLLDFSDVKMIIAVTGDEFENLPVTGKYCLALEPSPSGKTNTVGEIDFETYDDVMAAAQPSPGETASLEQNFRKIEPEAVCLIMFTSGTTRFPKGVLLTHRNILSQQASLKKLWKPQAGMRFLCYLPWHHSFGGLFERFFALHSGGCLAVDDSFGRDINQLFKNFEEIQPNIYFSVPKVYKEIISRVLTSQKAEKTFFHDELKFVFTAAAPLSLAISDVFKRKNIPVVEGWGLTETSPCCTLTELLLDRTPGVVGKPIPGVEVMLDEDDEILIRGANVMQGYYNLPDETARAIEESGWFHTGDIGTFTDEGLKILARKDRVFKLSNGEKIMPSLLEMKMGNICKFINHAYVFGSGHDYPKALIFPNFNLLHSDNIKDDANSHCTHPENCGALSTCFSHCLHNINCGADIKFEHIDQAVVIERELSLERNELTPSFKLVPRIVEKNFREYITCMEQEHPENLPADAFVVDICDRHCQQK